MLKVVNNMLRSQETKVVEVSLEEKLNTDYLEECYRSKAYSTAKRGIHESVKYVLVKRQTLSEWDIYIYLPGANKEWSECIMKWALKLVDELTGEHRTPTAYFRFDDKAYEESGRIYYLNIHMYGVS